jgi:hypothetical protein
MSMDRDKLEELLIEYIDGTLTEAEQKQVEAELVANPEAKKLYDQLNEVLGGMENASILTPSESLKNSFDHFLQQEVKQQPAGKSVTFIPFFYRAAAGFAILALVAIAGYWIRRDQQNQERITGIEKRLQEQQEENKRMMMALLDNNFSPSQRMQGVSVAYKMAEPDDEIVRTLVQTMNNDPNTNVRLAALEALGTFSTEQNVRKALIESLTLQKDPVVQIALIQQLVKMKEKSVVKQLDSMTKDSNTMKAVKDEAYSGIFKLS